MVLPEKDNIRLIGIEEEMSNSYLDYAMSVIVSRALPDVRDGLKQFKEEFSTQCMILE